jgi:predicted permease
MHSLVRDLRYGGRTLRRQPGAMVVAVIALTLGIGLTTTMFSIVYGALMRGLPFEEADRIVDVSRVDRTRDIQRMGVPIHDYLDYAEQQRSFEGLAAYYTGTVNVSGRERAERYDGAFVTANTFDLLGVRAVLGRTFQPGDDAPGAGRVAVIGYGVWRDRFGSDPAIVGQALRANGFPYTIVGVLPEGFAFPSSQQIWLPHGLDPLVLERGDGSSLRAWGRLRPGSTVESATMEIAAIARRLAEAHPETNENVEARVRPYLEAELGPEPRQLLMTMLGAVFLVLLIACANVANLLLDRAAHRTKEVGIRVALGASKWVVARQFLTEALVLALVGSVLGAGIGWAGVRLFNRAIVDTNPPFWLDIGLHPPVLGFVMLLAVVATFVSGGLPAFQASRGDINEILKDESRGASSLRIGRLSRALVVVEIALSCGLLVAAGLMIRSVAKLRTLDPGFTTENVFTARVGFPSAYTDTLAQVRFFDALEQQLAALPGVRSASLSSSLPGVGSNGSRFTIQGAAYARDQDLPETRYIAATASFFETFEVSAVRGRALTAEDRRGSQPVAIVNESFVQRFFPGEDAIGRSVRLGDVESTRPWMTIVGVVPDMYSGNSDEPFTPMMLLPLTQNRMSFVSIAVRTAAGDPMALTRQVRDVAAGIDADIPIYFVESMETALARPTWFVRVFGTIFMIFGFVALFLAAVGLYAVMAFSVSRRMREVGIRMAVGARTGHVVRMILGQGMAQLAIGLMIGLALAAAVSRLMQMVLFEVPPRDPVTFGAVLVVLTVTGLIACLVPALRATRVDPNLALRAD